MVSTRTSGKFWHNAFKWIIAPLEIPLNSVFRVALTILRIVDVAEGHY